VPGTDRLRSGRVAVVAQSGGVNLAIAFLLDRLGHGVSLAVGLGNAVDVDAVGVLEWLADDPNTQAVALHLEGVASGRRLYDTLRRITPRKTVVALVAGRADVGEFAQSHTGNLMGHRDRTVAALTQAGAVVVDSTEELAQAAAVLSMTRLPAAPRPGFGLVTGQAGPGLLIADGLAAAGLSLPELGPESRARVQSLLPPLTFVRNPVDTGRPGASFPLVVQAVGADPRIDAVLVFGLHEPDVLDPVQALAPAAGGLCKPVLFGSLGLEPDLRELRPAMLAAGLPLAEGPERLVLAARALAADARAQWRLRSNACAHPAEDSAPTAQPLHQPLDEDGAKRLLERHGLAGPARRRCATHDEAQSALAELDGPVAVKIASTELLHKTEVGGVQLNIRDASQLAAALSALDRIPLRGERAYLLERMAPAGVDLIVGGVRDASWGPCVMVGLGGVTAEALHDTAVRLAPVAPDDVDDMLRSLRGARLLDGFRELPCCDRQAIADAVTAIARLMALHPEVREVEVNPLRVYSRGALALDALVVVDGPSAD
jgi:acetyltransferase